MFHRTCVNVCVERERERERERDREGKQMYPHTHTPLSLSLSQDLFLGKTLFLPNTVPLYLSVTALLCSRFIFIVFLFSCLPFFLSFSSLSLSLSLEKKNTTNPLSPFPSPSPHPLYSSLGTSRRPSLRPGLCFLRAHAPPSPAPSPEWRHATPQGRG